MRLNLGCGSNRLDGFLNVDKEAKCNPDQVVDLEQLPWPWPDNSADEIRMTHVLEHLGETSDRFIGIVKEIHRVLKPDALVHIAVPHPFSIDFLADPTHVRPVTPETMACFSKRLNQETIDKGWPNTPLGIYHDIDLELVENTYGVKHPWSLLLDKAETQEQMVIACEIIAKAITEKLNVVEEMKMTLRKVPQQTQGA